MIVPPLPPALFASPLAFLEGIGAGEMVLVAVIGLLLFGGKGLPDMARTFGKVMREFKKASASVEEEMKRVMNEEPPTPPRKPPRPMVRVAAVATPTPSPESPAALPAPAHLPVSPDVASPVPPPAAQ